MVATIYSFQVIDVNVGDEVYVIDKFIDYSLTSEDDNNRYYDDQPFHELDWSRTQNKLKGRFWVVTDGLSYTKGGTLISYTIEDPDLFEIYPIVTSVGGLWHLEGREVVILADGNVLPAQTVTNGTISIPDGAGIVKIGLRYVTDIETLDIEIPGNSTVQGRTKNVHRLDMKLEKTRGGSYGPNFDNLTPLKQRLNEAYDEPIHLLTGSMPIVIEPEWNSNGRVFIRQDQPLPITILSITPDLEIGDDV